MLQAGMRVMGNITSGNDQATQVVVDNGGLDVLLKLVHYPRDRIQKEVFWALSNVAAGTIAQKQVQNGDGNALRLYDSLYYACVNLRLIDIFK